ncbi:PKD domain-containing protein [Frankia nepalensis]|uniref:PKD domain-containing protein n=1 Tax=Frankia nepalensis TaxID=1836974 RepID=UPI0028891548|nr:PKD domain-containing protein [Frankia nepalensis]
MVVEGLRRRGSGWVIPLAVATAVTAGLVPLATTTAAGAGGLPDCAPASPGGPVFVTDRCVDPDLREPYTDVDEQRVTTDPATGTTVRYRYIHGGFTGTNARFSFYFPAAEKYQGRFFEYTYPTIAEEDATPATIAFALSHGAYAVSTNNGGGVTAAPVLGGYRVNAAAAKYSRVVADGVYRKPGRPRGYIYGGSGGAYQTLGALENTSGVWDGGVPMVPGVPNAIPSFQASQVLALRVLADKLPQIADAVAPGGSGDPYAGLTPVQAGVLREVTRLGFPPRGWWQYGSMYGGSFGAVQAVVRATDPGYVNDFWNVPGYEGADDPAVAAARVQYDTTIQSLVGTPATGVVLAGLPAGDLTGADLVVTSGAAAGKSLTFGAIDGNTVSFPWGADPAVTNALAAGDRVRIDTSWSVALQYYQRHSVPGTDQYGWNQYRGAGGAPVYAQRPYLVGPLLAANAGGAAPTGRFHGKMIMLASTMDIQAYSWSADWYAKRATPARGGQTSDSFRLWYMDNADHVAPEAIGPGAAAHVVGYTGEWQRALLDLDAWVTRGVRPPASSRYTVDADSQVTVAATAGQRGGVQPVVALTARAARGKPAADRVEVVAGQPVAFTARASTPPGAGKIVKVEWDFVGAGTFPDPARGVRVGPEANVDATHVYGAPGTYFAVVRVTAQRDGDPRTPFALVQNLDTVRVVVR